MMRVWAYLWNEQIRVALLKEAVPEGVDVVELEVEHPDDVVVENGQIRVKTDQEKLEELRSQVYNQAVEGFRSRIAPTDYILIRFIEAMGLGEDTEPLRQKYAQKLDERKQLRQWWAEIKQRIAQAQDKEELLSIDLTPPV